MNSSPVIGESLSKRPFITAALTLLKLVVAGLIWLATAFCGVAGVLAWSPESNGWPSLIVDFAPGVMIVCFFIAAAAHALKLRGRLLNGALLFATSLWAVLLAPDLARQALIWPFPSATTIKLVQFNIQLDDIGTAQKFAWLSREDPDFITFQEVKDSRSPIVSKLQKIYPYKYTNVSSNGPGQTILMSKKPASVRGFLNGRPELAWATFYVRDEPVTVASAHISRTGADKASQLKLVKNLVAHLAAQGSVILAGDFNATPWSLGLRNFDNGLSITRRTLALPTWPAVPPKSPIAVSTALFPIDQIYASRSWRTVSVARGPYLGSDHYPVVATLTR